MTQDIPRMTKNDTRVTQDPGSTIHGNQELGSQAPRASHALPGPQGAWKGPMGDLEGPMGA